MSEKIIYTQAFTDWIGERALGDGGQRRRDAGRAAKSFLKRTLSGRWRGERGTIRINDMRAFLRVENFPNGSTDPEPIVSRHITRMVNEILRAPDVQLFDGGVNLLGICQYKGTQT